MNQEDPLNQTLSFDFRRMEFNKSIYVIEPHPDPDLAECHGFNLRSDFEVGIHFFWRFIYLFIFLPADFTAFLAIFHFLHGFQVVFSSFLKIVDAI